MAAIDTVKSMANHTEAIYAKLEEKGADMPEQMNLENIAPTIRTIKQGGGDGTLWGTLYTTQYPDGKVLTANDYLGLGLSSGVQDYSLSFGKVKHGDVIGYSFGSACSFAPNYFLSSCSNLMEVKYVEVLQEIGDNFLTSCARFNGVITFGGQLKSIGVSFMQNCFAFSQKLIVPKSVISIGVSFLRDAWDFTELRAETAAHPTDDGSLSATKVDSAMISRGITVTGAGASTWKAALPDRSFSPYRKLILVEE